MTAQPLPALASGDPSAWDQALYAFLVEKGNRSGSRRTVESYSRMLWPFFADLGKTPDRVKPADVLAWVHGIGKSGRTPSATNERVVVAGREFVSARLTPAGYAHGLALALPEIVAKARPTGFELPDAIPVERRIAVRGAGAWRALLESRTA